MAEPTTNTKPPETKPPETKPPEKKKESVPFPPPVESLSDHSKEVVRIWARQSKAGIIALCNHEGENGERCYHPAMEVMDPATGSVALKKDEKGRVYKVGRCSYVGDLHPEVRIYPPKKEDEI